MGWVACPKNNMWTAQKMITHDDYIQNNEMSATSDRKENVYSRARALFKKVCYILPPVCSW